MSTYAVVESGIATNMVVAEQEVATELGLIGPLDNLSPRPGVGWSYDATTDTWSAPTPPPLTAQQQTQVDATNTILQLQGNQAALVNQLEADIASVANWSTLTVEEQGAIIGRILQDGLGNIQTALNAHVTLYPPPPLPPGA